jgi:AraC family transcriptional regulator of arabinose operon
MPENEFKDVRITQAVSLIALNFNREFDFNELAKTLNLSPSRLRHLFRQQTGVSFRKYLRQQRMKQAKHLLETTFMSIKEIAQRVGIRDSSHFVREFEKEYKLSPKQYRNKFLG